MYDRTNSAPFDFLQSYLEIANMLQTGLLWLDEDLILSHNSAGLKTRYGC